MTTQAKYGEIESLVMKELGSSKDPKESREPRVSIVAAVIEKLPKSATSANNKLDLQKKATPEAAIAEL